MRAVALAAGALAAGGCAFGPGEPHGRLEASLDAGLAVASEREVGDGFVRLATGYELAFDELAVEVDALELVAASGEPAAFDPAAPPEGYSLCHNGHCHADDGSLVSYADVALELGAGGELGPTVLALPGGAVDVLAPTAWPFPCAGGCALPLGRVGLVRLTLGRITARGRARDGEEPPRLSGEVPLRLDVALAGSLPHVEVEPLGGRLEAPVAFEVSESEPLRVVLGLGLPLDVVWLDAADLATFEVGGELDLGLAADELRRWLAGVALSASLERPDD